VRVELCWPIALESDWFQTLLELEHHILVSKSLPFIFIQQLAPLQRGGGEPGLGVLGLPIRARRGARRDGAGVGLCRLNQVDP
jgi:hypothetical protein